MARSLSDALEELKTLAMIVFDFDGVMTDNTVYLSEDGTEMVRCHRGDGWGVKRLREAGVPMLILSTEENPVVAARAAKLRIECIHGASDKGRTLSNELRARALDPGCVIYLGNDENDADCLRMVGLPAVVADAHPSVMELAKAVLNTPGGSGAVRELADAILDRLETGSLGLCTGRNTRA